MPRLDHLLARNLNCSRSQARRLIAGGEIRTRDGEVPLDDPTQEITPSALPYGVFVGDDELDLHNVHHLMLNKPVGYITALEDKRHPVAYTLIEEAPLFHELRPVGRLDLDTTGLLLWTTDGTALHRLTHPKHRFPRTYQAALARPFGSAPPDFTLEDGHRPEIVGLATVASADLHPSLARPADAVAYATITIIGGAYHEVRRIFAALGSHVLALCRVSFGRLMLPADLALGDYRSIEIDDV